MSGFAGILHKNGQPVDSRVVRAVAETMAFRGPDALGTWAGGEAGLCHSMLRTTFEAESEHQPCSIDSAVWIAGDVRIDGRKDLLRLLRIDTVNGPKISDPELILHAYRKWQNRCVDYLLGDFAFAIWDSRNRCLFAARDHFGVRPFYYSESLQRLLFGNTLETIIRSRSVPYEVDEYAISDFLLFGLNRHPERTFFSHVRRLPPGHLLTWSADRGLNVHRYWKLPAPQPIRYRRPEDYQGHFLEVMRRAVSDRMRTSRIGLLMSGGMDSTTVAALAAEHRDNSMQLYDIRAIGFYLSRWIEDDERTFFEAAAKSIGIPSISIDTAQNRFAWPTDHSGRWQPEPPSELTTGIEGEDLKQAFSGLRVFLTGQGGDPALDPTPLSSISFLRNLLFGDLGQALIRYKIDRGRLPRIGFRKALRQWLGYSNKSSRNLFPPWIQPELDRRLGLQKRWEASEMHRACIDTLRSGAHSSLQRPGWSTFFENMDAQATGETVEARHPFFDLRVISFLLALPPVPWCVDKAILRQAMKNRLPERVLQRPKTPLQGFPVYEQLKQSRLNGLKNAVSHRDLAPFIDKRRVVPMLDHPEKLYPEEYHWITRPLGLAWWLRQQRPEPITPFKEALDDTGKQNQRQKTVPVTEAGVLRGNS
jgi:asparagine synthase (glutamine-hydrolysing)